MVMCDMMSRGCTIIMLFLGAMLASAEEVNLLSAIHQSFEVSHENCQLVLNQNTDEVDSTVDETWKAMIECVKQLTALGTDLSKVMTQSKVSNAHYLGSYTKLYAELLHLQGATLSTELQKEHDDATRNFTNVVAHNNYELLKLEPYTNYNTEGWDAHDPAVPAECHSSVWEGGVEKPCEADQLAAWTERQKTLKNYLAGDTASAEDKIVGSYDLNQSDGPVKMKDFDQEADDSRYAAGLHDFQLHCNKLAEQQHSGTHNIKIAGAAAAASNNSVQLGAATGCLTMFNGVCSHLVGSKAYHCENFKNAMYKLQVDQSQDEAVTDKTTTVTADLLKKACEKHSENAALPANAAAAAAAATSSLLQSRAADRAPDATADQTCEAWVGDTITSCIDPLQKPLPPLTDEKEDTAAYAARVKTQQDAEDAQHTACPQAMRKLDPDWFATVLDNNEYFPVPDEDKIDFKSECDKLGTDEDNDKAKCLTTMQDACGHRTVEDTGNCIDFNKWILHLAQRAHKWQLSKDEFVDGCSSLKDLGIHVIATSNHTGEGSEDNCKLVMEKFYTGCYEPLETSAGPAPAAVPDATAAPAATPGQSSSDQAALQKKCEALHATMLSELERLGNEPAAAVTPSAAGTPAAPP